MCCSVGWRPPRAGAGLFVIATLQIMMKLNVMSMKVL